MSTMLKRANFFLFLGVIFAKAAEDNKWVWGEGRERNERYYRPNYQSNRYPNNHDYNEGSLSVGFSPDNPGPYVADSSYIRPSYSGYNRPGPSGLIIRPYPDNEYNDYHSVPPWIRDDDRYRNYDTCRCRIPSNCPPAGLKLGVCAPNRRYCCFDSRIYPGSANSYDERPIYPHRPPNYYRPNYPPYTNNHDDRYPGNDYYNGNRNPAYSNLYPDNVDYNNRPYGRPYDYDHLGSQPVDFYSRSLAKNQTNDETTHRTA
ncbi:uncharacterized protein [Prorops nasuta]|uniref:uncharacterized protein n=1 Tax=Prorops nasuta TaxID=863751 RepID=UPI0034CD5845